MRASYDVHGQALVDYWRGGTDAVTILESSDGKMRKIPASAYFREPDSFFPVERAALNYVQGRVLVAGAGTGVHVLPLERAGFEVHAIDVSQGAVEVMQARGVGSVSREDIYTHRGHYDTLLFLGRNIGMAQTLAGIPHLLRTCQSLLRPGGILITNSVPEQPGTVDRSSEGYPGNLSFRIRYKDQVGDWVRWLHVDSQRLELAAKDLGWRTEIIYEEPGSDFAAMLRLPPRP